MVTIGYDMSMVSSVPGEAEEMAALDPLWDAAIKARDAFPKEARGTYDPVADKDRDVWGGTFANADLAYAAAQAEVMRVSELRDAAHRSYFRLNIWGMARYRDAMYAIGMAHDVDQPEWPEPSDYGITSEQSWSGPYEHDGDPEDPDTWHAMTETQRDSVRKFRAECKSLLASHPGETPGIPLFKFGSNDGWHVTPVECSSALQIFGEWLAVEGLSWQDALDNFRKADEVERTLIVANTALRHDMIPTLVGHAPFTPDETDNRKSNLAVYAEDYWLQWLLFLHNGVHCGGFTVS